MSEYTRPVKPELFATMSTRKQRREARGLVHHALTLLMGQTGLTPEQQVERFSTVIVGLAEAITILEAARDTAEARAPKFDAYEAEKAAYKAGVHEAQQAYFAATDHGEAAEGSVSVIVLDVEDES